MSSASTTTTTTTTTTIAPSATTTESANPRTSLQHRSPSRRPYRVGDILWVRRRGPDRNPLPYLYHHAGIVSEVDNNGNILEVVDFGPGGEGDDINLKQAMAGFATKPRVLRFDSPSATPDQVFPPGDRMVETEGPESRQEQEAVKARIRASLNQYHTYLLLETNCQFYADQMRFGNSGESKEATLGKAAISHGISAFGEATGRTFSAYANAVSQIQPFGNSGIGRLLNAVVILILIALIFALALVIGTLSGSITAASHWYGRRDEEGRIAPETRQPHDRRL